MRSFKDKVAAVTGAASGMGRALAIELAGRGCEVALCDVDESGLEQTVALCRPLGVRVTARRVDVAERQAVYAWAESVAREHGRVNLIFNNAGVGLACALESVSYEDFEWIMGVNFWGVVHGTKAFLPHLRASGEGHVVNTSSVFGLAAVPANGAYNATKFAVRGFTEALRQELELTGAPVSATCVHPGGIKTNIVRTARISPSVKDLRKIDEEKARKRFERLFITSAEQAARTILRAVERNRRRVLVGPDAFMIDLIVRLFPAGSQRFTMNLARRLER